MPEFFNPPRRLAQLVALTSTMGIFSEPKKKDKDFFVKKINSFETFQQEK